MASTFPTALDTIPDAPTTEKLGESAPKHSEMHNLLRDAIAAVEARIGVTNSNDTSTITNRLSAQGEGAAINAATSKTTPVDTDLFPLSDSAASWIKKKLSWAELKAALSTGGMVTAGTYSVTGGVEAIIAAGEKLGKISAITYNADGTLATYTQDRVTWTCAYDAAGRLSSETSQGGGTVKTYTYNTDGTLATVEVV